MIIEPPSHFPARFDTRRTMEEMTSVTAVGSAPQGALAIDPDAAECVPHPDCADIDLSTVLHALSDPVRLTIVAELAAKGGEHSCSSFNLPIVKSTATHHFRVLREAGVIRQRVMGTKRVNALRREELEARFPGLLDSILRAAVL
jgi:DNA-binding transcriptional ArsR family regulator